MESWRRSYLGRSAGLLSVTSGGPGEAAKQSPVEQQQEEALNQNAKPVANQKRRVSEQSPHHADQSDQQESDAEPRDEAQQTNDFVMCVCIELLSTSLRDLRLSKHDQC